jgi:hypothetical protein
MAFVLPCSFFVNPFTSASEIVLKMCDSEFMRKAKAADFISHAWDAMTHVAKSNHKV